MLIEGQAKTLTIVIPALNEEGAIGSTLQRCLEARDEICQSSNLDSIEIIVVSDGSTDGTEKVVRSFPEVKCLVFQQNRGYGAALKEGFREGSGGIVGFLDADGTCDPRYFARMCSVLLREQADIVLGSRLGPESKMPRIRRLGNRIYAFILGLLCGKFVTDTASGMRVIRRQALDDLYPLPDGLHFTPAMSARALLNGLRVIEIPMKYQERIGTSKLRVLKDGIRFLRVIFDGVLCYRPERIFLSIFMACLFVSVMMSVYPTEFYIKNGRLEEWMIYRFLACFLLGAVGFLAVCATALSNRMSGLGPPRNEAEGFWPAIASRVFSGRVLGGLVIGAVAISTLLVWPGLVEYVTTGHVTVHWSRVVVSGFGILLAIQALVTGILLKVLDIWKQQRPSRPK
jgi:glycosyltransferase involved in cell wall biosynthesis